MKIKGLDFLRVFGIFLVLIYHFVPEALPAGFFGVNVLFVLSGFLTSYHLIGELFASDDINIKKFYYKRFVRIFPPILLMLFLTSLAALGMDRDFTVKFFDQFFAAFSFNYNIFEILRGGSYEAQFIKQLFMHTWSLALEIHFYLYWPLAIALIYKKVHSHRRKEKLFLARFMETSFILFVISYLLGLVLTLINKDNINFVYFFDLTRLTSFVMGAMVAGFVKRYSYNKLPYNQITLVGVAILILLSLSLSYANPWTYYIGFLLADLVSAVLIIVAYSNTKLYDDPIMARLADYTYGMYVFHWPAFVITESLIGGSLGLLLTILITAGLVLFNFHIFEPVFKGKDLEWFNSKDQKFYSQALIIFMIIASFALAKASDQMSDDLVSLEGQIVKESIIQDIDKIKRDKAQVDEKIAEDLALIDDQKEDLTITVLGDSVLLGPRTYIEESIDNLFVNAEGSRELDIGADLISQMDANNNLGDVVVLALGTNAIKDPAISLDEIIYALPAGKRLIFVTAYDNRYEVPHRVSKAMRAIDGTYDFVTIMDWEEEALNHPEYYEGTDGVHYYDKVDAIAGYIRILEEAIDEAMRKPAKGE